jgi:hypothetical protein
MAPFFIENINNNNLGEVESIDDEESTITNVHGVVRHSIIIKTTDTIISMNLSSGWKMRRDTTRTTVSRFQVVTAGAGG